METGQKDFQQIILFKKNVVEKISELQNLVEIINDSIDNKPFFTLLSDLNEIKQKTKSETFKALVIGEFSTGKSTFINSLLGSNILPTDDNETTAVINIIKYGVEPEVTLVYWGEKDSDGVEISEGEIVKIPIEKISEFTTSLSEESNSAARKIKHVVLNYPSALCKDDVEIIDTPGLNSTIGYHEETTLNYLNNGHCAIMLLKSTQLFTKTELDYLKKFKRHLNKIFFVVNKIDLLKSDFYSDESIRSRARKLKDLDRENDFKYYLISSKKAVEGRRNESGVDEFINGFESFLASSDKAKEMILPSILQGLHIIGFVSPYLLTIQRGLTFSSKEFDKKIKELSPDLELIKNKIRDLNIFIDNKSKSIINKYEILVNEEFANYLHLLGKMILNYQGELEELQVDLESEIRIGLTNLYQDINDRIKLHIQDLSEEIEKRFNDYLASFDQYQYSISSALDSGNSLQVYKPVHSFSNRENFSLLLTQVGSGMGIGFIVGSIFTGPIGIFAAVLGSFVFSDYLEKKQREKKLREASEKIAKEIKIKVNQSIPLGKKKLLDSFNGMKLSMNKKMTESLDLVQNTIDTVRSQKNLESDRIEKRRSEINSYLSQLSAFENDLIQFKKLLLG